MGPLWRDLPCWCFGLNRNSQAQHFTAIVERGDIDDVVEATGTINPIVTVLVGSQVSGSIAKLYADFNSFVHKGEVIALIDPALFEGALVGAKSDLENAEANLEAAGANLAKLKAAMVQTKADGKLSSTCSITPSSIRLQIAKSRSVSGERLTIRRRSTSRTADLASDENIRRMFSIDSIGWTKPGHANGAAQA